MPRTALRRMPSILRLSTILCLLLLGACAPQSRLPRLPTDAVDAEAKVQEDMVIRDHLAKLDRLDRISWAIRSRNADLCGQNLVYRAGFTVMERDDMPKAMRTPYARNAGLKDKPTVFQLTPNGPAHAAGIRRGDVLLTVNGEEAPTRREANRLLTKAMEKDQGGRPLVLVVKRDGERREFIVPLESICPYETFLEVNPELNAYADGATIVVLSGIMGFTKNDDELAVIVGHEMAHNSQGHINSKKGNVILGALLLDLPIAILTGVNSNLGRQVGAQAYSVDYEFEADYVGLYFTARAGYDIEYVADFWRRMAIESPSGITLTSTHPSTSARYVALEAARDEIKAKMARGAHLRPESKEDK